MLQLEVALTGGLFQPERHGKYCGCAVKGVFSFRGGFSSSEWQRGFAMIGCATCFNCDVDCVQLSKDVCVCAQCAGFTSAL